MKNFIYTIIAIYLLIALLMAPFIHSNNANGYRSGSTGFNLGKSIGSSFYWPSYLFSIEPELDGSSIENFEKSIVNLIEYRNDKLFTGKKSPESAALVFNSIGLCLLKEMANTKDKSKANSAFDEIFHKKSGRDDIRLKIAKIFDGDDFADILAKGRDCEKDLTAQ